MAEGGSSGESSGGIGQEFHETWERLGGEVTIDGASILVIGCSKRMKTERGTVGAERQSGDRTRRSWRLEEEDQRECRLESSEVEEKGD